MWFRVAAPLSRLISEGLVVAEPQRGFRAAPISADELRDLTGVRAESEGLRCGAPSGAVRHHKL